MKWSWKDSASVLGIAAVCIGGGLVVGRVVVLAQNKPPVLSDTAKLHIKSALLNQTQKHYALSQSPAQIDANAADAELGKVVGQELAQVGCNLGQTGVVCHGKQYTIEPTTLALTAVPDPPKTQPKK